MRLQSCFDAEQHLSGRCELYVRRGGSPPSSHLLSPLNASGIGQFASNGLVRR